MNNPESHKPPGKLTPFSPEFDAEYFITTLSRIQPKSSHTDTIASKYLLEPSQPETLTSSWMKKKLFIESLVQILPSKEDPSIPTSFLWRILRAANMVGAAPTYLSDLETRVARRLDQTELEELMVPCFGHACKTLLDSDLVFRVVRGFLGSEDGATRSGAALGKVAKLVDDYLAEAAVDSHFGLPEFVELASAIPSHARSMDDGLYRAVDMYLKAHPSLSKQDRKRAFGLIDSRKLSTEASLHASQNERLPVRAVIQVLLSEQNKLSRHVIDWSGSLSGARSPAIGLNGPTRCVSKREMNTQQQMEIRRLKEDVLKLQSQCMRMEKLIEKLVENKKGSFSWKKLWN